MFCVHSPVAHCPVCHWPCFGIPFLSCQDEKPFLVADYYHLLSPYFVCGMSCCHVVPGMVHHRIVALPVAAHVACTAHTTTPAVAAS